MNLGSLLLVLSLVCAACQRPARSGELIDRYRGAQCVEPTIAKGVDPPTRGWDAALTIADGSTVNVRGAQMVGGTIVVGYGLRGPEIVAVKPGDYVYPSDVRIDETRSQLYVKASGLAGGIWQETWLYEYSLSHVVAGVVGLSLGAYFGAGGAPLPHGERWWNAEDFRIASLATGVMCGLGCAAVQARAKAG